MLFKSRYVVVFNLQQLTTHILTLTMWHNRFRQNENEASEAHIPRHRDSKTKKPWHRDSKAEKPGHRDSKTKKSRHRVSAEFWPLCPLIFYTSCGSCSSSLVSLEVFPQHKSCWSCRQLLYVTLFFISPLFLCLFNLEFQNLLLSVPSVPSCYFPPLYLFHPTLFYSSFYSLFCFLPLFIRFIFWSPLLFSFHICYPFFSLSYCSVLSASPLCSVPIQSVLFLLVFIILDTSI